MDADTAFTLNSFQKIDSVEVNGCYTFYDVKVDKYHANRRLQYQACSSVTKSNLLIEGKKQEWSTIKVRSIKTRDFTNCIECGEMISSDMLDEGMYDCPNEACKITGFAENFGLDLTALINELSFLPHEHFLAIGGTKKCLLVNMFNIQLDDNGSIVKIKKCD